MYGLGSVVYRDIRSLMGFIDLRCEVNILHDLSWLVIEKTLAKVHMIGNKFSMSERVSMYHLSYNILDLDIIIEFCEFDQFMSFTQLEY